MTVVINGQPPNKETFLNRPVIDGTGIKGRYQLSFKRPIDLMFAMTQTRSATPIFRHRPGDGPGGRGGGPGGGWDQSAKFQRVSARYRYYGPTLRVSDIGLR